MEHNIVLEIASECENTESAKMLFELFGDGASDGDTRLRLDTEGLWLCANGQELRGDFTRMLPRIKSGRLGGEFLVRAAKIKDAIPPLYALDATAGLGEDSFLLAAAGFNVTLYERNPVIYALLCDALARAAAVPELADIAARMTVYNGDSIAAMAALETPPDIILLDPMFPERQKSSLVKKKLQMIQKLEVPCNDERSMLISAMRARPRKLIVKRPPKGAHLADVKPQYSIEGKAVRYDCFVNPFDRIDEYEK